MLDRSLSPFEGSLGLRGTAITLEIELFTIQKVKSTGNHMDQTYLTFRTPSHSMWGKRVGAMNNQMRIKRLRLRRAPQEI